MNGVMLEKGEYGFLKAAMSKNRAYAAGALGTVVIDDEGRAMSTNGYCLNLVKLKVYSRPGYYVWHREAEQLVRLDDDMLAGSPSLVKSMGEVIKKYETEMLYNEPTEIVSYMGNYLDTGLHLARAKAKMAFVLFRKAVYRDKLVSVCCGIGAAPISWHNGEMRQESMDEYITINLELLQAIEAYMPRATMQWRDNRSPAFFRNDAGWMSLVMPIAAPKEKRNGR